MSAPDFDYQKYLQLIAKRKRLFIVSALLIMTGAVILSYSLPKKYEAQSTVFIEKNVLSDLVKGLAVTPSIEEKVRVLTYAMSSRTLLLKVVDELDLNLKKHNESQVEGMIKNFQKNTDIKLKDKEGLFIVSFTHENPRLSRDYVNTLVRRYIEDNISSKREESYGANRFLSEQLANFKEQMEKAEANLNVFKEEKGSIIGLDDASILKEIALAQQRADELRIRRTQLESLQHSLKKGDPLKVRLGALQKSLDELQVVYTDNYPEVIRVRSEIDAVREQMRHRPQGDLPVTEPQELEKVEIELKAVREGEGIQRNIIATNRTLLREIPAVKSKLEELEREKNNRKLIYEQLAARHGQSEVSKQVEVQDKSTTFRIVDPAVLPMSPVSPNRIRIILLGIVAGLAGALGIIMLLDYLDRSVKGVEMIKPFGFPVVAVFPKIQDQEEILREKRRDARLYRFAALYFVLILFFLALEGIRISPLAVYLQDISIDQHLSNITDSWK